MLRPETGCPIHGAYKESCVIPEPCCGITIQPCEGVVDAAIEDGLIGTQSLNRLEQLAQHGLKIKMIKSTPKKSFAKGVGGNAVVEGVALIPSGVGKDASLLLPVKLLRALEANINLKTLQMQLQSHGVSVNLHEVPSGHITVNVLHFADEGFVVPPEAGMTSEFTSEDPCFREAMIAQGQSSALASRSKTAAVLTTFIRGALPESSEFGERSSSRGSGAGACGNRFPPTQSMAKLTRHPRQDWRDFGAGLFANRSRRIVFGLGLATALLGCHRTGEDRGLLLCGDPRCSATQTLGSQDGAPGGYRLALPHSRVEAMPGCRGRRAKNVMPGGKTHCELRKRKRSSRTETGRASWE